MSTNIAYKMVDQYGYSRRGFSGETLWLPVGTKVRPTGEGSAPCGPGVLHGYIAPEVALLANPIHAKVQDPRILTIESDQPWETDGLKRWTQGRCTTLDELAMPVLTMDERVAWAICLSPHESTRQWAINWLSGKDRSVVSACAAKAEAYAAWAAEAEAWEAEARVAWAAARAAACAAAACASEARVAWAAAWAASRSAACASEAAAWAAHTAEYAAEIHFHNFATFEARLLPTLSHAKQILSGSIPADQYDNLQV
jgi:hypothetical protein